MDYSLVSHAARYILLDVSRAIKTEGLASTGFAAKAWVICRESRPREA